MSIGPAANRQTLIRDIELIALDTLNRMAFHHHGQIDMWTDRLAQRMSASPAALRSSIEAAESTLAEHQAKYDQIMAELLRRDQAEKAAQAIKVEFTDETQDWEIRVHGEIIGYAGTQGEGEDRAKAYLANLAAFEVRVEREAAQASKALETPSAPAAQPYKAGRNSAAEARAILDRDKAAGVWTDEHARADQLAAQLAEALAWVVDYRNRADATPSRQKAERKRLYEKANESALYAGELGGELAEAMANIAAGDTSHGPWIEESEAEAPIWNDPRLAEIAAEIMAERVAYVESGDPLAGLEHDLTYRDPNYYGRSDETDADGPDHIDVLTEEIGGQFTADQLDRIASTQPPTLANELAASLMLARNNLAEQLNRASDPNRPDSQRWEQAAIDNMARIHRMESELAAQLAAEQEESRAGVEETRQHKGVPMPAVPTVETSDAARQLPQALADLRKAATARDLAYGRKAEAKEELDRLEAAITAQILAETNPETGKPMYTNDPSRKAAIRAALDNYQEPANYLAADDEHTAAKTAYDLAEQEVKTLRALLAYQTAQLGLQPEIMATNRQNDSIPF
jgi:hypothetical protein